MNQPNSESSVSIGSIADRAEKLEAHVEKPAETKPEEKPAGESKPAETPAAKPEDKKPAETPATPAPKPEEKPLPNDPTELRKWNTKVSMELAEVKKQIQGIADALSKSTKKQVDWKELAKSPEKLQAAVDELQKQANDEWQKKYEDASFASKSRITRIENQRRMHDPNYPRWQELNSVVVKLASEADRRIDFDKDPEEVLDQLYQVAIEDVAKDPNYKAPAAPAAPKVDAKYSEVELQAKIAEAVKKAVEEAQKGLAAEENGAGVGGMGKGAPKGQGGVDKKALWNMPLSDLKDAIQQATDKR